MVKKNLCNFPKAATTYSEAPESVMAKSSVMVKSAGLKIESPKGAIRMLNKKSAMMFGLLCAFLIVMGASSASAQSCPAGAICASGTNLPQNASACVGPFYSNGTSVELDGQVTNNVIPSPDNPRWTIHWSPDNIQPTVKIFKTEAFGVTEDIIRNQQPQYFPGYFTACVFNYDTGVSINYTISIGPGQF